MTPQVEVGQMVLWYDGGQTGLAGQPAVVTQVNLMGSSVCLNIFDPSSYNLRIRDGVRWVRDPAAKQIEYMENGGWDLTPLHRRFLELEKLVKELS